MATIASETLLTAIKKDDVKAFRALMEQTDCAGLRLGRFPLLSLFYLYRARKLIAAYEVPFLQVTSWEALPEPASLSMRFAEKAGKCLRLYLDEVVSPLEMLLILDRTYKLKKVFPLAKAPEDVRKRLRAIYYIRYALGIRFEGRNIFPDRRPLSRREKKKLACAVIGGVLALAIVVATPVTTVALLPKRAEGDVYRLSDIDFTADKTYTLKRNITLPENFSCATTACTIVGEGHRLTLGKNASLGELSGSLSDLEIRTFGTPIFTLCAPTSTLSDLDIEVDARVEVAADSAFVTLANYGTMDGVRLHVRGNVTASAPSDPDADAPSELVFGGVALDNAYTVVNAAQRFYGTIKNCTVHYDDFTLSGVLEANASFGGVVGVNTGVVRDCLVSGNIDADTFDLAGVCYRNDQLLSGVTNEADLAQRAALADWTPVTAGVVIENTLQVENCRNVGALSVTGPEGVICGGVAARNSGTITHCMSEGAITLTAKSASAGGIFGQSEYRTDATGRYLYLGMADFCLATGRITATLSGDDPSGVGGVGGTLQQVSVEQYQRDEFGFPLPDPDSPGNWLTQISYWCGSVSHCIFMGEGNVTGATGAFGNIVGMCGAEVYKDNGFVSDGVEFVIFDGNLYRTNGKGAIGSLATGEQTFLPASDKGAEAATEAAIQAGDTYREILSALGL